MQLELLLFIIGIIGLWFGAGITIRGATEIAKKLNISYLFIGLTVLSIGTSLPEIFTNLAASLKILNGIDAAGVAVGTDVGSSILQLTLILGTLGFFAVIKSSKTIQRRDGLVMLCAIALLWVLGYNGLISQLEGILMAGLYLAYIFWIARDEKGIKELIEPHHKPIDGKKKRHILMDISHIIIGLVLLGITSQWVVNNTLFFAKTFGIEQTFIGLMIVGASTALPELTTSIRGIMSGAKEMSLGVLIGSSITNPMFVLGMGAAISTYKISRSLLQFDIPFWFAISALILIFFRDKKLAKWEAAALVGAYICYAGYKFYTII